MVDKRRIRHVLTSAAAYLHPVHDHYHIRRLDEWRYLSATSIDIECFDVGPALDDTPLRQCCRRQSERTPLNKPFDVSALPPFNNSEADTRYVFLHIACAAGQGCIPTMFELLIVLSWSSPYPNSWTVRALV